MKWIGISGGWRKTNKEIEEKVRSIVRDIIIRGDGIVSGGALGVDYFALDEALKHNASINRIKIFLPVPLEVYALHYRKRAAEGIVASDQAESLISQLTDLKNRDEGAVIEKTNNLIVDTATYYERNSAIVNLADELVAFHITSEKSEGLGTIDTIKKAEKKGIPIRIFSFNLTG